MPIFPVYQVHRFARMSVTLPILRAECTDFPGLQIMKLGYFSWDALWGKNGVLGPFAKTKEADVARAAGASVAAASGTPAEQVSMDDMREIFVARYRDGQRRVLEDALATLWGMMGGAEEVEQGERSS